MKRADLYTMYEIIHLMRLHKNLIKNVNQSNVREHDARPTNDDEAPECDNDDLMEDDYGMKMVAALLTGKTHLNLNLIVYVSTRSISAAFIFPHIKSFSTEHRICCSFAINEQNHIQLG